MADTSMSRKVLGFEPTVDFEQGLAYTFEHLERSPDVMQPSQVGTAY